MHASQYKVLRYKSRINKYAHLQEEIFFCISLIWATEKKIWHDLAQKIINFEFFFKLSGLISRYKKGLSNFI